MTTTRYRCNCGEVCDSRDELTEHQGTCSEARYSGGAYGEMSMTTPTDGVLAEVERERRVQLEGWGNVHDDHHAPHDWLALLTRHAGRAAFDGSQFRRRMVVIAALAVAAAEWYDRTEGRVRLGFEQNSPFVDYEKWDAWVNGQDRP